MATVVATLSEFAIPSMGGTCSIRRVYAFWRNCAALSTKDQGSLETSARAHRANAAGSLFSNYDPSVSGFQFGEGIARALANAPGRPALSALRCLHESAFT
jgi:hypothetical protein